jgi:hypothetical protein
MLNLILRRRADEARNQFLDLLEAGWKGRPPQAGRRRSNGERIGDQRGRPCDA